MKGTAPLESYWDTGLQAKSLVAEHKLRKPEGRERKQGKPGGEGLRGEEAMQGGWRRAWQARGTA